MSLLTPWGYTLTDADALPDLMTPEAFDDATAGKYSGDRRIGPGLAAASAAVRDFCGWHLFPALTCSLTERLLMGNGRVKAVGPDLMVQLPTAFVPELTEVTVDGAAWTDLDMSPGGILHLFDAGRRTLTRRTEIAVRYTAGIPEAMMAQVREIVAHRVAGALAVPAGVASESAGGVSVTYSALWTQNSAAASLTDDSREALRPYRVEGVF